MCDSQTWDETQTQSQDESQVTELRESPSPYLNDPFVIEHSERMPQEARDEVLEIGLNPDPSDPAVADYLLTMGLVFVLVQDGDLIADTDVIDLHNAFVERITQNLQPA